MADGRLNAMGGGCVGGLAGVFLGLVIGAWIGPMIATFKNNLRKNPDPLAKQWSGIFDGCSGFRDIGGGWSWGHNRSN
jgi:hypothetical protein